MEAVARFLKENAISEVESTLPDMTGNARGKFYPPKKFLDEKGGRIPETLLVQTVTGDWAANHFDIVDAADKDMILQPDPDNKAQAPCGCLEPFYLQMVCCLPGSPKKHKPT